MGPFGDAPRPVVVGHRGAPVAAPENTPASFTAAAAAGASWVELDARRSHDGAVVVHHDAWLPDGAAVVDLERRDLRARGVWALDEVVAALPAGLGVDVELKNLPGEPDYDETDALVAGLVGVLDTAGDRPLLASSFNPATVLAVRARLPDLPAGLLVAPGTRTASGVAVAVELGAQVYCPHAGSPDLLPAGLAAAHTAGLQVLVWTVDDAEQARQLAAAGVDALCTNDPAAIVRALATA